MTTFKFHFRPPARDGSEYGTVFVRIIHGRRYRDLRRDYSVRPDEWDAETCWLHTRVTGLSSERLKHTEASMRTDLLRLESIVNRLGRRGDYSVNDIVGCFRETGANDTLLSFSAFAGQELIAGGRTRTARAYRSAAKSLAAFLGGRDPLLCELDSALLRTYERHLLDKGLQMNTISFYMRNLRALYYKAVAAGIIPRAESNPFEEVFTGVYETRRRSLDQQDIKALAACVHSLPPEEGRLRNALHYFLFAYHARGMSFIDLAYLKKSDIKNDTVLYKRRKTGFYIEVKITRPMKKIIDHYLHTNRASPYLFPILDPDGPDIRLQYETALNRQNRNLKELAATAGVTKTISTHVARHTWATLAKRMGYGINLISEGLGHRDPRITTIYLASFGRSAMDALSVRLSNAVGTA